MTYEVWHYEGDDRYKRFDESAFEDWPGSSYKRVGTVSANDLHDAYRKTNSIDSPWWTNEGVTLEPGVPGARSLSVGDVLVATAGSATKAFGVARMGFTNLGGSRVKEGD